MCIRNVRFNQLNHCCLRIALELIADPFAVVQYVKCKWCSCSQFIFESSVWNYAEKYVSLKMEAIENRMLDYEQKNQFRHENFNRSELNGNRIWLIVSLQLNDTISRWLCSESIFSDCVRACVCIVASILSLSLSLLYTALKPQTRL